MLNGLRKAGNSFIGRIILTTMFGILIVSFAIWGIGDIFRGGPRNTVATVGRTEISYDQFRNAYNTEIQRLSRQFRTNLTQEQARGFGLDQRVLSRLISEAVLNERAKTLGLSASDQLIIRSIMEEPSLKTPSGQFDRSRFEQLLRDNSMTEAGFVAEQRAALVRLHLVDGLTGSLYVPLAAREALHRYGAERRTAAYLIVPPAAAGEIPAPTAEQLDAFFKDRKASFNAPEYRAIALLALNANALAKPETISDADARQRYEREKAKYGTPERRTIQQISFPTKEEAEAASNRVKEGTPFDTVASERNVGASDLELGTFTKSEMLDSAVADAAFALQEGAVSGPVEGRFGPVLLRVTKVQPDSVRTYEDVAADVKRELAQERARAEIEDVHDAIEDQRAGARPLAEIAKEKGLTLIQVPAIERSGKDKAGRPVENLPERDSALQAAFASDIGVDNEPLRARDGGFVWYDVTGIEPTRERTLAEVRDEVAGQWREDQVAQRLADKARQLTERLEKGESIEAVAAEIGAQAKTATDLARRQAKDEITADAVSRIFATPVGKAGNAINDQDSRVVFKVTGATVPPLLTTTEAAQRIEDQLRDGMSDDILAQYISQVQKDLGVYIDQQAVRRAVGGDV